ncbi:hypothetical protein G3I59_41195 [Amycolatopsis rubida]|uniref:Polyketide cyclase / dehydrase and lipid transport n=1 Tax=Amycolatopsis rubida TaxID=112413 RepID=A0A1I5K510_9PSEU|nr:MULTISPECIES: hypothetical protein [Amycolatopsis]MYW96860.1 hypothetical protein [Amycolatopsis rubida]NEC61845.1 hypothetical protein [Amycolatopsis rubida]OAP23666.1 hypothetical protein A4R44_05526 [Amycolatopsis sp. M39]SFO79701.1 hypothetical protein SAMN05421854_10320 [Amycolatopsis rubida]
MRTIVEVSGVVSAAPAEVFARLEKRLTAAACSMKLEVDRDRRFLAAQGGWWYRGEYEVAAGPAGSLVTHRIRNAATGQWWAVLAANRLFLGFRERVRAGFLTALPGLADDGTGRNG